MEVTIRLSFTLAPDIQPSLSYVQSKKDITDNNPNNAPIGSPSGSSRIISGWQQRVKERQETLVVTICENQGCRQDAVLVLRLTSDMDITFRSQFHRFIIVLVKVGTCFALMTYRHPPVHNLWVEQCIFSQRMRGHADGLSYPVLFDGSLLVHAVRVVMVELCPVN